MAATTQTAMEVSLKLIVNKETNKVIFAEANSDFVDILFSFLTLPLGTIARLVEKDSDIGPVTVGSLNSLYHSVEDLDKDCFLNETYKKMLLQPKNSSEDYCSNLKLNIDDTELTKYFVCSKFDTCFYRCVSIFPNTICTCGSPLTCPVFLTHSFKGFVSNIATFVITDDLIVMPNSLDYTGLALLHNYRINSISSMMEMTVNVTREKVLDLLKCALISNSVLTDLFLGKKPFLERSSFFPCEVENTCNIQIKLKLFMKKTDGKILFAQGEEDFADLIFSFLMFPLGGVVRKFGGKCSLDSIDQMYKSIVDIDENRYFMSKEAKNRLVNPRKQLLPIEQPRRALYLHYHRDKLHESINQYDYHMNHDISFKSVRMSPISPYETHGVSVKGPRTYVVTDDLIVTPSSPISILHVIDRLGTPLNDLHEMMVTIGDKECLSILKASLTSTSALTNGLRHLFTQVKKEY